VQKGRIRRVRPWEAIAENLREAGWTCGCVATLDQEGRRIFVADAHRDDGRRFVVHSDEKLTAFLELERAICLHLLTNQIVEKQNPFGTTRQQLPAVSHSETHAHSAIALQRAKGRQ
jgi:hypothetical protein